MNWKHAFTSSVGKKLVMGLTGIFLVLFLVVHAYINALVFLPDGKEKFLTAAKFMGTNPITRILEIGLFAGFILHAVQGVMLTAQNKAKRPVKYAVKTEKKSTWYSRSMGLLGSLILIFLVVHLAHFWVPARITGLGTHADLYEKMQAVFSNIIPVIIYTIGCIALAWHLAHGFWSAFHSLGLNTVKYRNLIKNIGFAYAIIIPALFIAMPWAFFLGLVK